MGVRHGFGALLCGLLLPLAGCGDGDSSADPPTSPAPTSSSSTPTATPSGPVVPEAAKGTDEESAKAFVRFWFKTLNRGMNSGDTSDLKSLRTQRCNTCAAFERAITKSYSGGGSMDAEGWRVRRMLRIPDRPGMVLYAATVIGRERVYGPDGSLERSFEGGRERLNISLRQGETGWLMDRMVILR